MRRYARRMVRLPARRRALDAVLAVVAFWFTLMVLGSAEFGDKDARELDVLGVLLAALASLPLAFLSRAPLAIFAAMSAASATLDLIGYQSGPPAGPTIALFLLASRADETRARSWLTAAVVVVAFVVHAGASAVAEERIPTEALLFGTLLWGGAWVFGDQLRQRRERRREVEERIRRSAREADRERRLAAAEERTRIARDLHDSAGHAINVILVHAGLGRLRTERDPAGAREAFETIEDVARETVGEIDELVRVLREDEDGRDGVEPPPGVAALEGLIERHRAAGLDVTIGFAGERRPLSPGVDRAAYRIVQEALTNAARHGDGSARVQLAFGDGGLELTVVNRLRPDRTARRADGHGITGMRERAAQLGGSLQVRARDRDFTVHARLPSPRRPS
jgi:signal transduction histidine kinase